MADLTETEKLKWLGVIGSARAANPVQRYVNILSENVQDYSTFKSDVDSNVSSLSELNTYLTNNGFTQTQADNFVALIEQAFEDEDSSGTVFDEFEALVIGSESYAEFAAGFPDAPGLVADAQSENRVPKAGVRVHNRPGLSEDGIKVPPGTVEVYGERIEFSSAGFGGSAGSPGNPNISWTDTSVSESSPPLGDTITVSSLVSNSGNEPTVVSAYLVVDGVIEQSDGAVTVYPSATLPVEFDFTVDSLASIELAVSKAKPVTINPVPSGL